MKKVDMKMMEKYIFDRHQAEMATRGDNKGGYAVLIGMIDPEKFVDIYYTSTRKLRNMVEGLYHKKIKKGSGRKVSLTSTKDRVEIANSVQHGILAAMDEYMGEELLKAWLYTKRPMLTTALDFFGVEHEDGLTDKDLSAFEKAEVETLEKLIKELQAKECLIEDIAIYFQFMHIDNALKVAAIKKVFGDWGTLVEEEKPAE